MSGFLHSCVYYAGSMIFSEGGIGMSLEKLQSVDIRTVKPEDVVDIQQIKIDDGL